MKILRPIKYIAYLLLAFVLFVTALVWWEEYKVTDTGVAPTYESDRELYELVEKGKTTGLSREESKRLDWLIADKKKKAEAQLQEFLQHQKKTEKIGSEAN